jgi:beta-lactamase superfamily II metal-dependent hydrolase
MNIKFLKAGTGDAILINRDKCNILIDGGNNNTYLIEQVREIYERGEKIDLLIVTHHDDDHINGIISLIKLVIAEEFGDKNKFIDRVIFNSPKLIAAKKETNDHQLSFKQANELDQLLSKIQHNREIVDENTLPFNIKGIKISCLSPSQEDLKNYSNEKGAYLSSDYKCDWDVSMSFLDQFINDSSQDTTIANLTSIVLKLECEGRSFLLTGDVTPKRLENITDILVTKNGGPVVFDYVKLPHHASYRSLNKKILENIICQNFIVSTDSTKYFLPNKRALLKVLKYSTRDKRTPISFLFNYEEAITKLDISEKEKIHYNFTLVKNNKPYGIDI